MSLFSAVFPMPTAGLDTSRYVINDCQTLTDLKYLLNKWMNQKKMLTDLEDKDFVTLPLGSTLLSFLLSLFYFFSKKNKQKTPVFLNMFHLDYTQNKLVDFAKTLAKSCWGEGWQAEFKN